MARLKAIQRAWKGQPPRNLEVAQPGFSQVPAEVLRRFYDIPKSRALSAIFAIKDGQVDVSSERWPIVDSTNDGGRVGY